MKLVEGESKQLLDERLLKDQRKRSGDDEDAPYERLQLHAEMAPSGTLGGAGARYKADGAADSVSRVDTFGNLPVNARSVSELAYAIARRCRCSSPFALAGPGACGPGAQRFSFDDSLAARCDY